MSKTLAFVTIIVTHTGTSGIPVGTEFVSTEPVPCITGSDEGIKKIEQLGGKADAVCDYTFAPATSIRPKARPQ